MSRLIRVFICRESLTIHKFLRSTITPTLLHNIRPLHRFISSETSINQHSFTTSYLINSCGLSPGSAVKVSKRVNIKNADNPDSVLSFLKNHGFSQKEIALLVVNRPDLLLANIQNTLLPKFEYFYSIGVSRTDLPVILSKNAALLSRSLENQIVPCCEFFRSVFQSDKKFVAAIKRTSWAIICNFRNKLGPNLVHLQNLGVPTKCLSLMLSHFPEGLTAKHIEFKEAVEEVKKMGFDPKKTTFVLAINARSLKSRRLLCNRCSEVYRRWGWSEDDISMAFHKHPNCMLLSEKKITKAMDFFVNKMGVQSKMIAANPRILFFNLEKRIIPRCSVIQVLSSNGVIKKLPSLATLLRPSDKDFLEKFVMEYLEKVPQVLNIYNEKMAS